MTENPPDETKKHTQAEIEEAIAILDQETKRRVEEVKQQVAFMCASMRAQGKTEINKLPMAIRKMTVKKFCEKYGADELYFLTQQTQRRVEAAIKKRPSLNDTQDTSVKKRVRTEPDEKEKESSLGTKVKLVEVMEKELLKSVEEEKPITETVEKEDDVMETIASEIPLTECVEIEIENEPPATVEREIGGSAIIQGETEDTVEKDATAIETVEDKTETIENAGKDLSIPEIVEKVSVIEKLEQESSESENNMKDSEQEAVIIIKEATKIPKTQEAEKFGPLFINLKNKSRPTITIQLDPDLDTDELENLSIDTSKEDLEKLSISQRKRVLDQIQDIQNQLENVKELL